MSQRCPHLRRALRVFEAIAPAKLAAKWDNVGLLVDATKRFEPAGSAYKVFLTNDLTPKVLEEAIASKANVIVTYHPTPFSGLKQFKMESHAASVVLQCAREGIAVYSPHTALDAVVGGINDWLVDGIAGQLSLPTSFSVPVKKSDDPEAAALGVGDGRLAVLSRSAALADLIQAVKSHLNLTHVQVALPAERLASVAGGAEAVKEAAKSIMCSSFAVCAGSGSSVLAGCKADLYVTGEMSHHDVLAANHAGVSVILTHHSNCERGYLRILSERIRSTWAATESVDGSDAATVECVISECDADPLTII